MTTISVAVRMRALRKLYSLAEDLSKHFLQLEETLKSTFTPAHLASQSRDQFVKVSEGDDASTDIPIPPEWEEIPEVERLLGLVFLDMRYACRVFKRCQEDGENGEIVYDLYDRFIDSILQRVMGELQYSRYLLLERILWTRGPYA